MATTLETWALPRLQQLLPLDDESLRQIITYADSLPKDSAADHLKNLLGDDAKSLDFIASFNMRRHHAPSPSNATREPVARDPPPVDAAAKPSHKSAKKKPNIHALPARQVHGRGDLTGAYRKRDEEHYLAGTSRQSHKYQGNLALQDEPRDAARMPLMTADAAPTAQPATSKPLASDSLAPAQKGMRKSSPAPKAKVNISGGTAMHGASTALSDLDSAIRSLEIQTNPSLTGSADDARRKCNCMATRHPLLDMAPNCLSCGKVICVKEGLGPCTFCKSPLLSSDDVHKMLRVLKDERGEERMKSNNAAHKRAEVSQGKARAFTGRDFLAQASSARSSPLSSAPATPAGSDDEAASAKAKAHRDKLLGFQANNARRTQIHDEAADFDLPSAGTNMWATPQERAQQLKKQQKMLREMEWNAKPEYEKRQVVASIDVKAGKVVRRMAEIEKPDFGANDDPDDETQHDVPVFNGGGGGGGAFSKNPLARGLIRPVAKQDPGTGVSREKRTMWRRVQDQGDNEQWILDGGIHGSQSPDVPLGDEERACG
ncbi:hypothetical protein CERZMDRAFT_86993 [Cercospora zeae-maydis SCOH1-5]|uniref:TRIP4/RQT4 C2HC5-type zinc finger domain-containing protein n=1 Tax=Cercospora zeae-maydis SCOH1-5 TaxID=717836 RepID=A0A6A6F733_9PEZI|nr:hypothetical protein CERZMDRAFT_86993 [Cercospora zeae-maydis SCOH1-5]